MGRGGAQHIVTETMAQPHFLCVASNALLVAILSIFFAMFGSRFGGVSCKAAKAGAGTGAREGRAAELAYGLDWGRVMGGPPRALRSL